MVTFQLPSGPRNLQELFPAVNFANVEEYYLQLESIEDSSIIATTNRFSRGCGCNDVRLFFVNYLGGIDAISFSKYQEENEVRSSRWKKPLRYPLEKFDGGLQRTNVASNEILYLRNTCYTEPDQEWIKELQAAPGAWIHWIGQQGQDDQHLPVIIQDAKFITRKEAERYIYVLEIAVEMSNDNLTVR